MAATSRPLRCPSRQVRKAPVSSVTLSRLASSRRPSRKSGSHETRRWREMDSNHRSPVRRAAVLSLPPSPAEAVGVVAEAMVPAEIAAQIARLRSPTADGALRSLRWKVE